MVTKLMAARIAMAAGCRMVIAKGDALHPLAALEAGARATWFIPSSEPRTARKRWIAGAVNPVGALDVDAGAAAALKRGTSLLPAGVHRSRARSSAATPSSSAVPTGASSRAGCRPIRATTRAPSPATRAARSRRSWAIAAATR